MGSKIFPVLLSFFFFFLGSCKEKEVDKSQEDARKLFDESATTIKSFINALKTSSDSLMIDSLMKAFDKKMVDTNFSFPPETDLKMTEQENDSLYKLMLDLQNLKKDKLESFSYSMENDSLVDITSSPN